QADAFLAQAQGFLEVGDADHRRAERLEHAGDGDEAVAVRVGLEDRQDPRAGGEVRDGAVVLREPGEVGLEARRAQLGGAVRRLVQRSHGAWRSTPIRAVAPARRWAVPGCGALRGSYGSGQQQRWWWLRSETRGQIESRRTWRRRSPGESRPTAPSLR